MKIDPNLLSSIYTGRLQYLRGRAEDCGIAKTGSVEVLRAKLICEEIIPEIDLSWEGIQSLSNKELGNVLKVFGIKSSGSHKERRQRLWLHLNYDSRRLTIENLAEMSRDDLHELCKNLELDLTGNRTILMGRVAGVLTSQMNGWGRIKRSLRRNGLRNAPFEAVDGNESEKQIQEPIAKKSDFQKIPATAVLEDATDSILRAIDEQDKDTQGDLLTIGARVGDLERMVGTILRMRGGNWSNDEQEMLLRLAIRRGWPIGNDFVKRRVVSVATNIAESKGATLGIEGSNSTISGSDEIVSRVRKKLSNLPDAEVD